MSLTAVSQVLDTHDVDEARSVIAAGYCDHRLSVARARQNFHAVQDEWRVGRVRVHHLRYGVEVAIDASPLEDCILVSSPVTGVLTVATEDIERRYGPGEIVAIGPDHPFALRWEEDCSLRTVQVSRSALASYGGNWVERHNSLPAQHGVSPKDAPSWGMLTSLLQLQAESETSTALLVERLESLLVTALLEHHAHPEENSRPARLAPTYIKAAIEYIEANADRAISPADMAAAAHMSIRAFQYNLQKYTGRTPSQFLRDIRLERVHRDLLASDPLTETVARIAHRWGFGNLGRFSHYYEQRFGFLPSETLRSPLK